LDKHCGRYGRYRGHAQTDYTQVILYLSNVMNCIGWTDNDDDDGDDVY